MMNTKKPKRDDALAISMDYEMEYKRLQEQMCKLRTQYSEQVGQLMEENNKLKDALVNLALKL